MTHPRNDIFQDGGCHTWSTLSILCTLFFLVLASLTATAESQDASQALARLQATCDGKTQTGTGFIVALQDGTAFIATAQHVVAGCDVIRATFAAAPTVERSARVYQMDAAADLAVLRAEDPPAGVEVLPVSGRVVEPRSKAEMAGYPLRAPKPRFADVKISNLEGSMLSITGLAGPGSSGSPVVQEGSAVAMVTRLMGGYLKAVPGTTLRMVLGGFLEDVFPPDPDSEDAPPSAVTQQFPCTGTIAKPPGVKLREVRSIPSRGAPSRMMIEGGTDVTLHRRCGAEGWVWYQIDYEANRFAIAWVRESFIQPGASCPSPELEDVAECH